MSDYIKREDAIEALQSCHKTKVCSLVSQNEALVNIEVLPSADVVEVGIITCLGIKFVVEDDIIKVKWRHGDKHYIVPFGGLLELWEKYEEQEYE